MAGDYYVDVTQGGPYTFFNPAAAAAAPCVANPTVQVGGIGGYVPPFNPPAAGGAPWPGWPGGWVGGYGGYIASAWPGYASDERVQALEMRTATLEARLLRLERQVRRRLVRKGKSPHGCRSSDGSTRTAD